MNNTIFHFPLGQIPESILQLELNELELRTAQILSYFTTPYTKTDIIREVESAIRYLSIEKHAEKVTKSHITAAIKTLQDNGVVEKLSTGRFLMNPEYRLSVFNGTKELTPLHNAIFYLNEHDTFGYNKHYASLLAGYLLERVDVIIKAFNLTSEFEWSDSVETYFIPFLAQINDFSKLPMIVRAMSGMARDRFFKWMPYFIDHTNYSEWFDFLEKTNAPTTAIHATLSCLHLYMPLNELEQELKRWYKTPSAGFFLEALKGNKEKALEMAEAFVAYIHEEEGHKRKQLPGFYGVLYSIVMTTTRDPKRINAGATFVRNTIKEIPKSKFTDEHLLHSFAKGMVKVLDHLSGKENTNYYLLEKPFQHNWNPKATYLKELLASFIGKQQHWEVPPLSHISPRLELEMRAIGFTSQGESESNATLRLEELKASQDPYGAITDLFTQAEDWENLLALLNATVEDSGKKESAKPKKNEKRLVWFIDPVREDYIKAYEQSRSKEKWNKGKERSLRSIAKTPPVFCSEHDLKIIAHLHLDRYGCYIKNWTKFIPTLTDHPHLYTWDEPHLPIEIVIQEAQLELNKNNHGVEVSLHPHSPSQRIIKESMTRYAFIEWPEQLLGVFRLLQESNQKSMLIPGKEVQKANQTLKALGEVLPVGGNFVEQNNQTSKSDAVPVVQLTPVDAQLHVQLLIEVIEGTELRVVPGIGSSTINGKDANGNRIQVERNKKQELQQKEELGQKISFFQEMIDYRSELFLEEDEEILDFLSELKSKASEVKVIWPKGERLRIEKVVSYGDMNINVKESNNWFEIGGDVTISDELKLSMLELLDRSKGGQLNYIPLDEKTFITIEKDVRKRLADLDAVAEVKGKKLAVHPLGTNAIEGLVANVPNANLDEAWHNHIQQLDRLRDYQPELPSNLQATLRPYQESGFIWLDRLHQWGVGACLADDMGLGKTLQSIALLLKHGANGPSLVVAPSSVCQNWITEIKRFAPTLDTIELRNQSRESVIKSLKENQVLIISYGLIQSNPDLLAKKQWNIAILDEAHAIKNSKSVRSQAVMKIKAKFRMITTGTPIQNHLGELWNLFQFINPGMLGSYDRFNKRYVQFENDGVRHKNRQALNRYISPFILRRHKSEVLDDLPEKTEMVLNVSLSEQERALYETIRSTAVENISKSEETGGTRHVQILSEITKLRQVSCHPALLDAGSNLPSAKLQALETLVDDLLGANHKALIFSQFTSHLHLIEAMLQQKGISYQYLDGSNSTKQRQEAIQNFQSGNSDLFLISLKAGGVGLNLTAADYVIHMDPWWNPAIEDQASDRAHRIGQTRPVTIYRIIAENTIEEKIVKLHHEKRNLADLLLAGTDQAAKISSEELFELIQS